MSQAAKTNPRSAPFRFKIAGMDCANCARTIEQGVRELDGISDAQVNFASEVLEGRGHFDFDMLQKRVAALGYRLVEPSGGDAPTEAEPERSLVGLRGFLAYVWADAATRRAAWFALAALATLPLLAFVAAPWAADLAALAHWIAIAAVGYPIANRGLRSLLYARRITIDLLMTAAALGAVAIGASGEAVTVILLFTLGEALEGYSAARSRHSLKALLNLKPDRATVVHRHEEADGSTHTHYRQQPVADLVPGDLVQVKAGERITCDGSIAEGLSEIDEAAITGEPIPVTKSAGDEVFAGTINGRGTLLIEVTRRADDFTIARIGQLVEQAQAQRSEAERFVDRFASWYTPAVVLLAVTVAVLPPLAFGQPFLAPADGAPGWLYRGLALLIVACPCALIISIPVTVVSALTRLAALGVLVKGGAQLTALADARVFAFDKTGTLTHGRPVVTGIRARDCAHRESDPDDCAPCDDLVALAASVERGSSHPLAQAVIDAAATRQLQHRYDTATEITTHTGQGVTGILNGRRLTVGQQALFQSAEALEDWLPEQDLSDDTLMLVGENDAVLGYIRVDDRVRAESAEALGALKGLDERFRFVMLTGDRRPVADAVAAQLKLIDEVQAELMPEQKLDAVRALEDRHGDVAMIGDGINDAPALARAKLGIAMGGAGSHQAMEIADVVLMRDDLMALPRAVRLARKTRSLVRQNIALSLGLKFAFLALAIPGLATLWMAVLADVGATVLVTMNGMRMLRAR